MMVSGNEAEEKVYVLVYKESPTGKEFYFERNNLYLGEAQLANTIELARKMILEEAEDNFGLMYKPEKWSIWSIKKDWVLDERYEGHIIKKQIKKLEEQLRNLKGQVGEKQEVDSDPYVDL